MSDNQTGGSPLQTLLIIGLLAGAGYFVYTRVQDQGLDGLTLTSFRGENVRNEDPFVDPRHFDSIGSNYDIPSMPREVNSSAVPSPSDLQTTPVSTGYFGNASEDVFGNGNNDANLRRMDSNGDNPSRRIIKHNHEIRHGMYQNIRIGAWAMDGFGPSKLANRDVRAYIAKVMRKFDLVAVSQVAAIERDVIPRLVDEINRGENRFDFILSATTGPDKTGEQLAFIFDTTTLEVDRAATYTADERFGNYSFQPLVACFRAAVPPPEQAWTFSAINLRVDLKRAADEVAQVGRLVQRVRDDGRGEDDIVVAGLFQADDAYLGPTLGDDFELSVHHRTTDIFDRYQTANVAILKRPTTEYLGRGGVYDFVRTFELNQTEAEAISSHLPVYAEFTAHEGGKL